MKGLVLAFSLISTLTTQAVTEAQGPGSQPIISEIQFEGNQVFPDHELLDALELNKKGDPYIPAEFEYDLQVNLGARYRNNGYINVKVDAPRVEVIGDSGAPQPLHRIVVSIQEGSRFVYGRFEVVGITAFPDDEVRRIFGSTSQEVVNYGALKTAFVELKQLYGSQGYLDMNVIPTMTPHMTARELDIQVEVLEGEQYLFNQVRFEIAEDPAIQDSQRVKQDLRNTWLLTEGQLCRSDLVEESIQRINSLGYFDPLEEGDWEFVKEDGKADVVVRLTRK